jgi:hypothetical protein
MQDPDAVCNLVDIKDVRAGRQLRSAARPSQA